MEALGLNTRRFSQCAPCRSAHLSCSPFSTLFLLTPLSTLSLSLSLFLSLSLSLSLSFSLFSFSLAISVYPSISLSLFPLCHLANHYNTFPITSILRCKMTIHPQPSSVSTQTQAVCPSSKTAPPRFTSAHKVCHVLSDVVDPCLFFFLYEALPFF